METAPPAKALVILSIVGILMIATIPVLAFTLYNETEVRSPTADATSDAKINAQNNEP